MYSCYWMGDKNSSGFNSSISPPIQILNQTSKLKNPSPLSLFYFPPIKHIVNMSAKFAGILFLYHLNWCSQGWRTITTVVWRLCSTMWQIYWLIPLPFLKRMLRCQQKSNAYQNGSHEHYHLYSSSFSFWGHSQH